MSGNGICVSFKVALIGEKGVGKSTLAKMWQQIPSYDKLLNGVPPPPAMASLPSTEFVSYESIDVVVKNCTEAAAHRVYLMDTPGAEERRVLRDGLIQKSALQGGVDGVIILIDINKQDTENLTQKTKQLMQQCIDNESFVLLIHRGGVIPDELQKMGDYTHTVATKDLESGIVEETRALIKFTESMHARAIYRRDEEYLAKEELNRNIQKASSQKKVMSLPSRKIVYQAFPETSSEASKDIRVALYGGPCTGKSTFMASLLDGFSLYDYEPTDRLEVGTMSFNFPPGDIVNVTLLDGPEVEKQTMVALGVVFVDMTSPFALELAANSIDALTPQTTPPKFVVIGTKNDIGYIVSYDDVVQFAGELGAPFEVIDPRRNHEELFARMLTSLLDEDANVQKKIQRQAVFYNATLVSNAIDIPHTEEEMMALFNRYDIDGNGYIDKKEAEKLYKDFDRAGLGDFQTAMSRLKERYRIMKEDNKLSFDQFSIIMCEIAKL